MSRSNRDDFSAATVRDLARRASYICSNPECHNLTIRPASNDLEKIVFLGKAAHITAASPRGARYDPSLTVAERRDIKNGIFLCPGCADKIDKNEGQDYSIDLLQKWKRDHEKWVAKNLNKSIHSLVDLRAPSLHLTFDNGLTTCEIEKRRVGDEWVKQKGELSDRIVRVDLRLANSGSGPANDIDVILGLDLKFHLHSKEELRRLWDVYPLDPINKPEEYFAEMFRRRNRPAKEKLVAVMVDELGFGIFEDLLGPRRQALSLTNVNPILAKIESRQITFRVTKLKQNMTRMLESFYVVFPKWNYVRSFTIDYRLNSDEMISDTLGTLKFKVKTITDKRRQSPKIGQQDEFEGLYIEKFRSQARPFGEFVKYERDRAALDAGIHLTTKTNSKFRSVSNTRVWFQLKGIQETTLSLAEHDKGSEIALDLPIDDLRFWYASPEPVYLVVYIEAADHFLAEDIMDVIDRQWGESIFNANTFRDQQKYARVRLSRKAILDDAVCMLSHRSMRIDGPSFRGRPLGHRLDPLRCIPEKFEPGVFDQLVNRLLAVHGYRETEKLDPTPLFPNCSLTGDVVSLATGTLNHTYEWVWQMSTEFGFNEGSDFRIEGRRPPQGWSIR
jgi:hypothetical protein